MKLIGDFECSLVSDNLVHVYTDLIQFIFHSLLYFDLQDRIVCYSFTQEIKIIKIVRIGDSLGETFKKHSFGSNLTSVAYIIYSYFPVGCCGNTCHIKIKGLHSRYKRCNTHDPLRKAMHGERDLPGR